MSTMRGTSGAVLIAALAIGGVAAGWGESVGRRPVGDGAAATASVPDGRASEAAGRFSERYGISKELAATVIRHATRAGVSPEIAFGLIRVESGFDPLAVGSRGERGLMQIKPSTARGYERDLPAERLFRPDVNLRIGLAHLKREVDHFGDWSLGLVAYNMGRSRVRSILRSGRRPPEGYADRVLADCSEGCT